MAIKPPLLRQGDTVGIVTLGSPLDAESIDASVDTLRSLGYGVALGRSVYAADGFLAGTDRERADDFMEMIGDPNVSMILPTRGGVGVQGILPHLDYAAIARNPKIVSGYSDITALLNALYQEAGLIAFHSLMLLNFTPIEPAYNYNQFFAAVSAVSAERAILNPPEMPPLIGRVPGTASGPIVGGNLTSIVGTLGTAFEIDTTGKILFLEETHEPINHVFRMIDQLRMAGKFEECAGIVMGQCTQCIAAYGIDYEELIQRFLVPLGKPMITNLATGHGFYKAAIPIGANAAMDGEEATLVVTESAVAIS